MRAHRIIRALLLSLLPLALAACGGGGVTTLGGSVSGLNTGTAVTLLNNGGDALVVGSNGDFKFTPEYPSGDSYNVTVSVQPSGLVCTVVNGQGTIDKNATKVRNIEVTCTPGLSVGGTVSGLATGASVTLQNNGVDAVTVSANSTFAFPGLLKPGATYEVTVSEQPTGQTCSVAQGSGTIVNSNVTIVVVTCS